MIQSTGFEKNLDILHRSLAVSSLRDRVYADNIANAETPNFKRTRVSFEAELAKALESERNPSARLELRQTSQRHVSATPSTRYNEIQPRRMLDFLTTAHNNGNNVDIDVEVQQALGNQMMYTLLTQVTGHQFRQIEVVLR